MIILGNFCYFESLLTNSLYLICFRRDEFSGRRYEARGVSPERKAPVNTGRSFGSRKFEDSTRERYSDKYESGNSKWNAQPESNSWGSGDHRSWHSNTGFESSRISMNSNIGTSSISRLHPGSEISQGGISSRGYYGSNNRRY